MNIGIIWSLIFGLSIMVWIYEFVSRNIYDKWIKRVKWLQIMGLYESVKLMGAKNK